MTQDISALFATAYAEARSAFSRKDIDVSVTFESEMEEDDRYAARVVHNRTLAISHGPDPETALAALLLRIRTIAWREDFAKDVEVQVKERAHCARQRMTTLSPEDADNEAINK